MLNLIINLKRKIKKVNPKNKKKIKNYQTALKIFSAKKVSSYKKNWYICNDYIYLNNDFNTSASNVQYYTEYSKVKSLFFESKNKFNHKLYKLIPLYNDITKHSGHFNFLDTIENLKKGFFVLFVTSDIKTIHNLHLIEGFDNLPFSYVQKTSEDLYFRYSKINTISSLIDFLQKENVLKWFSNYKALHGLCFFLYHNRLFSFYDFLILFCLMLSTSNSLDIEKITKEEYSLILTKFFEDSDNLLYKNIEADILSLVYGNLKVITELFKCYDFSSMLSYFANIKTYEILNNKKTTEIFFHPNFKDLCYCSSFVFELNNLI